MKVLVVGDLHSGAHHPRAIEFIKEMEEKYNPDQIIQIGDFFNGACFSMHQRDVDFLSATEEIDGVIRFSREWYENFPNAIMLKGNHYTSLERSLRRAELPNFVLRRVEDIIGLPEVTMVDSYEIDDVLFLHGESQGGQYAAKNLALKTGKSVVSGHAHSLFSANYMNYYGQMKVGVNCGCLVDTNNDAFRYGKNFLNKPINGLVIIDTETLNVQFERLI